MAIIPRYRDTRLAVYWNPITTPISGYHVTDIGTPDIVPDIDPNIRYASVVYDIGDMMTRYDWVCTGLDIGTRYRVTSDMYLYRGFPVPISGQRPWKTPISGHMTRYRVIG